MPRLLTRDGRDLAERRVILLEFVSASAILVIIAILLAMVFFFQPV